MPSFIIVLLAFLGQAPVLPSPPDELRPSCAQTSCRGKHIEHTSGVVRFCVPRGMKISRTAGFEGDIQDLVTLHQRGTVSQLLVRSWGPFGYQKSLPDWLNSDSAKEGHSSIHAWRCSEGAGGDYRLAKDGRQSRFLQFPLGWAEYSDVSPDVAARFDRVLDSLCCRPLPSAER